MIKIRNKGRFPMRLGKCFAGIAAAAMLVACKTDDGQESGEIFIEAIPNMSSQFIFQNARDNPQEAFKQPIQLSFDHSAYFASPTSSLLYRGEYLSYAHDQGHLNAGSVLVENRTTHWQGPLLTLPPMQESVTYRASVWIRLLNTDNPARVKLILTRVSGGSPTTLVLKDISAEPRTWQNVAGEFVGAAQADTDIYALSLEVESTDKYLLDDILVARADMSEKWQATPTAVKAAEMDFISNGGVEEGVEPWTHQGGIISRSVSHAHTGKHSLLISGRKQEWNAPMMFVKSLQDNQLYRFSIFARLNEGQRAANVRLTLRRTTAGQTTFTPIATSQATDAGWTEVAGTFSAGDISESEKVSVYLECEDPTASYFVDTLSVERISTN